MDEDQYFEKKAQQKLIEIKVRKVINSCTTTAEFNSCRNYINLFFKLGLYRDYPDQSLLCADLHGYLTQRMEIFNCN